MESLSTAFIFNSISKEAFTIIIGSLLFIIFCIAYPSKVLLIYEAYTVEEKEPRHVSMKWTIATILASLSPFIVGSLILFFFKSFIFFEEYIIETLNNFTLMFAAISISTSAYFDFLFADSLLKDRMKEKVKINNHIFFFVIVFLVFLFYLPAQLADSTTFVAAVSTVVILIGSSYYAFVVKRTIFEIEKSISKELEILQQEVHENREGKIRVAKKSTSKLDKFKGLEL